MNESTTSRMLTLTLIPVAVLVLGIVWQRGQMDSSENSVVSAGPKDLADPCALALAPHSRSATTDTRISQLQQEIRESATPTSKLEQLGWLFVRKARISYDSGFYKLAEACAACIESGDLDSLEALLLRTHVMQSLHRFNDAEPLARRLVSRRGLAFDYGVLGDVLIDQGKTSEAVVAYQRMIDLRPDLQSYTRAAHVRWLKGDLPGAIELMKLAAGSGSPADPESAAWAFTRLALYELQANDPKQSLEASAAALGFLNDYAPALLAQGRALVSIGKLDEAIPALTRAADLNPFPDYLWMLADTLHLAGKTSEAGAVEKRLLETGAHNDPRTFAVYLATRGQDLDTAIRLAKDELKARSDVHTHDALSWSLAVSGNPRDAESHMARALSEATKDARLFLHAGVVATMLGQKGEGRRWLTKANQIRQMLLPSERHLLAKYFES